jgi:3-mercaptopyruvate sulfurtransferase SseA
MIELAELVSRLDDPELTILDVRSRPEFTGERGYPSDPRQGRIPGARHLSVSELIVRGPEEIRELVGLPEGAEVVAYCHTGGRCSRGAADGGLSSPKLRRLVARVVAASGAPRGDRPLRTVQVTT